ncbi:MAG: histidine phosphatase super family protein [Rhodospirillales bacterium]|nr:histidine phosphatase super family protein [Rhodospirillales bacterium]
MSLETFEPVSRTLYFVRHGETDWNVQKRLLGHKDIPLNDNGRKEAADAGVCLRWLNANFVDLDYTSGPLGRTRETMEIARATVGLDPIAYRVDERFKEVDFGEWEGLTWAQVRHTDPLRFQSREADLWGYPMPGGESYAMAAMRVSEALELITRDCVIVSHGGIARTILVLLGGVDVQAAPQLAIPQDKILVFRNGTFAWLQATTDLEIW